MFNRRILSLILITIIMISTTNVFAAELPETIVRDGRVFTMDKTAGGGKDTATPDFNMDTMMLRSPYKVTGSDVRLYVDYSHGHGGDHFAAGWVEATAPSFTARAEIWANGRLVMTGSNNSNIGNRATAASYLAVGIVQNAVPRIFYNW